jgi:hypothetical protein
MLRCRGPTEIGVLLMESITAVLSYTPAPFFEDLVDRLSRLPLVSRVIVVAADERPVRRNHQWTVLSGGITQEATLSAVVDTVETSHMLFVLTGSDFTVIPSGLERLMATAEAEDAGIVYADFYDEGGGGRFHHPVNDYQTGSVREGFEFGPAILVSVEAIREGTTRHGRTLGLRFAGLYDMRLMLSIDHPLCHIPEPLSVRAGEGGSLKGDRLFSYVDPRNVEAQKEMEHVFTRYLKRIGAYLSRHRLKPFTPDAMPFPVEASVVIPVRNRKGTIMDAVLSALAQETDFSFNVIVVDNHSTDGTTDVLAGLAARNGRLGHLTPNRTDLGIGGCWNEAIDSARCGRYAVQLDSDDLYRDSGSLQRIVDMFREGEYGAVIGAYTLVDKDMNEIPPGLIDHREWTEENGHNNALRVNGLGAPRAFNTSLIRRIRFPNVSYGEDYSAALRICREYRVGRIFDSLYLCRRWAGNTDSLLTIEEANRHDAYKDSLRTEEIGARQKKNREEKRENA